MLDHWKKFGPPAYIGIAAAYGITQKTHEKGTMEDLANMFAGSGGIIR